MSIHGTFTTEDTYIMTHAVGPTQSGIRLDAFLKQYYRKRSREQIKRAIETGRITVKREMSAHFKLGRLKPSFQLQPGDVVEVLSERKPEPSVNFDYRVLFEDDVLFVIEKPANLPVHPAGRYFFNTLLIHLKTQGHRDPLRMERDYFLVHRIDKETSGILVLAKDREVCTSLTAQFANRETEKTYLAIVYGITPEEFTVDLAIRRSQSSRVSLKMETLPHEQTQRLRSPMELLLEAAKTPSERNELRSRPKDPDIPLPAMTRFRRIETAGNFSLVECFPKTGRQHQIRVHLESAGHPIVGDKLYGRSEEEALAYVNREHLSPEAEAKLLLPRQALHSSGIRFTHPVSLEKVEFRCDLPQDLRKFMGEQR